MSRSVLILVNDNVRFKAIQWVKNAPLKTRVEFKEPKRSLPQNDRMWAMLTDISKQALLGGQKYTTEEWKVIFMDALGREMRFLPKLEGQGYLPMGHSSSDLSIKEMGNLMELIAAWGTQNGVIFSDPKWHDYDH